MIYVVYSRDTFHALSIASAEPPSVPEGAALYVDARPWSELHQLEWRTATQTLERRAPAVRDVLTRLEFASRFSLQEQVAIEVARSTHPDATMRATLHVLQANLDRATEVRLSDERTVMGATVLVDVLIGAGVVPAAHRAQRIAALLAPVPVAAVGLEESP